MKPLATALAFGLSLFAPFAHAGEGVRAEAGRVRWCEAAACRPGGPAAGRGWLDSLRAALPEERAYLEALRAQGREHPGVLWRLARTQLADGDTTAADSLLGAPALAASLWAWPALRTRAEIAAARGNMARAAALVAAADVRAWPDGERAEWLERHARFQAARGQRAEAFDAARQVVLRYPALPPVTRAIALLDSLAAAARESLSVPDLRAMAEAQALRGARTAAVDRLRAVRARVSDAERFRVTLRMAELMRAARRPLATRALAESALAQAADPAARVRAGLERARAVRDAGTSDSALVFYERVARAAADPALRATAWWEYAREAEDDSRFALAAEGFARVSESSDARADEARLRAGLMRFVLGDDEAARAWWRRSTSEGARFWLGVSLRAGDRAAGDSLLGTLAHRPGYAFYRAAARETLGVRGWPGLAAEAACAGAGPCVALDEARWLADAQLADEARLVLAHAASGDPRAVGEGWTPQGPQLLALAQLALELGQIGSASRLGERAFSAAPGDSERWAAVVWAYPPAFEREVVAAETLGVSRALTWALIRQESRFEPRARSASDALGLTQMKLSTAQDVARLLRERAPEEGTLFTPGPSIRYGVRYYAQLLKRFGGSDAVALAAYNAGPGTIRKDWPALLARGGAALFCELASNADSQDYARRILGYAQAYRELAPTFGP